MSEKAGGGGGGGGEDDDDSEGIEEKPERVHIRRQRMGGGCMRARTLLLRPIKRLQARKERNQQQRQRRPPSPPSRPPYDEDFVATGCHLCFMPPTRHHPNRDGSKPPSYHDFLRSLLEKNDFYSPDCNVHREVP